MAKNQSILNSIFAFAFLFALVSYQAISAPVALVLANDPISNPVSIPVSNPISSPIDTPTSTLNNGLLAYWKMDSTSSARMTGILDYSYNGFNGTAVNAVLPVEGKIAGAANLNGINSYITTSKSSALSPANVSVSTWVKVNAYTGSYPRIFSKFGSYDLNMYTTAGNEGRLEWDVRLPAEKDAVTSVANRLRLGTWYHIATVYNGSSSLIYINGVKVAEKPLLSGNITSSVSHPFTLGSLSNTGRNAAIDIDETRVYNRALTVSEILELAQKN